MKFGKRQLVLAVLVLALGTAVYLNWQFTSNEDLIVNNTTTSSMTESEKELGAATYVNTEAGSEEEKSAEGSGNESSQTPNMTSSASEYFAKTKLARQQARDTANELLKTTISDQNVSNDIKASAIEKSVEMAQNIEQEANIEGLIKAKGFSESVAFIQNGECNVAVSTTGLLDSEAITIKDIVASQTGLQYNKIKIVEVK